MKTKRFVGVSWIVGLALLAGSGFAQQQILDPVVLSPEFLRLQRGQLAPDIATASQAALKTLAQMANRGAPERFGFATAPPLDGPRQLAALSPLREAVVQLDDLKKYQATDDSFKLVQVLERQMFPVSVGNQVYSSMTLAKSATGWSAVAFGAPRLIRSVMAARVLASNATKPQTATSRQSDGAPPGPGDPLLRPGNAANYMVVRVTGLNQVFLGAEGNSPGTKILYLVPLLSLSDSASPKACLCSRRKYSSS